MLRTALPEIITDTLPGPKAQALIDRRAQAVPAAIRCVYPVAIARGEGAMLEDLDGNRFLDWIGGVGVLNIGYSHPEVIDAVKAQAEQYFHGMFNIVTHEGYVALAEKLAQLAPVRGTAKKVFFANSGAEADENAVKIARAYTGRPNLITFSGAFHGRTLLTMTLTAKKAYTTGLGPLATGVYRAQFPYLYRSPDGLSEEEVLPPASRASKMSLRRAPPPTRWPPSFWSPFREKAASSPPPFPGSRPSERCAMTTASS